MAGRAPGVRRPRFRPARAAVIIGACLRTSKARIAAAPAGPGGGAQPSSSSSSPASSPSPRPIALAGALDDDRPHGPYLIGAWTFGDRPSLDAAVKAGAIDEVSVDWLQSRADGSVAAPRLDTGFIAEAKRKDCRVFATLTDYDESQHTFDPAISAAILATRGVDAAARPRGGSLV